MGVVARSWIFTLLRAQGRHEATDPQSKSLARDVDHVPPIHGPTASQQNGRFGQHQIGVFIWALTTACQGPADI
jgi:hypothetical protein